MKKIFFLRLSVNKILSRVFCYNVYKYKFFFVEEIKILLIWKEIFLNMLMLLKFRFWNIIVYLGLRLFYKDIIME